MRGVVELAAFQVHGFSELEDFYQAGDSTLDPGLIELLVGHGQYQEFENVAGGSQVFRQVYGCSTTCQVGRGKRAIGVLMFPGQLDRLLYFFIRIFPGAGQFPLLLQVSIQCHRDSYQAMGSPAGTVEQILFGLAPDQPFNGPGLIITGSPLVAGR